MAKRVSKQGQLNHATAAGLQKKPSTLADEYQNYSHQAVEEEQQLRPTNKVEGGQNPQKQKGIDRPATVDAPPSIQPATDIEKAEAITQYAELFCTHIDGKFAAVSNRVALLNRQVMETVRRSKCTNIRKFHGFYEQWYPKRLQDTPDVMNGVGVELNRLEIVQDWWWKRIVEVPTQAERRRFVLDVFERIKEDMGVLQIYETIDALCEEYKHGRMSAC